MGAGLSLLCEGGWLLGWVFGADDGMGFGLAWVAGVLFAWGLLFGGCLGVRVGLDRVGVALFGSWGRW